MLGHTANAKKSSKFEDSDSRMSRPRALSDLPHRTSQRLKPAAAAGAEATGSGGAPRRALGVRKKPAVAGCGAGAAPRVAELESKLEKAHDQLMGMRHQLAAAEKARKDARAALADSKKRLAAKKKDDDAASSAPPVVHDGGKVPAPAYEAAVIGAEGAKPNATDAFEAIMTSESRKNDAPIVEEGNKTTSDGEEASNNAVADDVDGKKGSAEIELLRAKLMAKDMEVYELRAKLMVIDTEVDDLRSKVTAKSTELEELKAKLMLNNELVDKLTASLLVKDAEVAAVEADNADLTKIAEEAAEAVKATSARARETEHALRESAAREARLAERLRASEHAREALEAEAQRSRVQSEQWRKAAEEAAAVLGGSGVGRVATGASGTDKRRHGPAASAGAGESEGAAAKDGDEEGPNGKRKAGGAMRALSDLWKKKAQK
ncbi:hypothetical protein HU200_023971 [Digitaria exilis]|uniref:Uncharacterized protein n=1 Tax=Digitaria exilis TaxID=1010633 RepID=A0A835C9P6_9POAL|nr:hypothetical protein HU200_023971 [Digitaria exilis]